MKSVYVITMWSGGRPARSWKSYGEPEALPTGTGVSFLNIETKLRVQVIGNISVEQYESGKEAFEATVERDPAIRPETKRKPNPKQRPQGRG